jgi:hypothetical protein
MLRDAHLELEWAHGKEVAIVQRTNGDESTIDERAAGAVQVPEHQPRRPVNQQTVQGAHSLNIQPYIAPLGATDDRDRAVQGCADTAEAAVLDDELARGGLERMIGPLGSWLGGRVHGRESSGTWPALCFLIGRLGRQS